MKVCCVFPSIIVHPLAVEYITRYGNFTVNGETFTFPRSTRNLYICDKSFLNECKRGVTENDLSKCYITNDMTGETFPLYIAVPCGKCPVCRQQKINAFVQRCELETLMYNNKPIFLTLTYNEKTLPEKGVNVRDVQLYLKRVRINLERCGYQEKIRYVFVGEYGRRTHRPHYHAILWNLSQSDMVEYSQIREILSSSWDKGFILSRFIDPSDNKTFYYTAKYLRKDCCIPEGKNETFICCSNRGGGIGSAYIDFIADSIIRDLDTSPKFVNKWNGQVKDLILSKYVLSRMLPTISKSIPSIVKNSMRILNVCYVNLKMRHHPAVALFDSQYEEYNNLFSKYFFCPLVSEDDVKSSPSIFYMTDEKCIRDMLDADNVLTSWYLKGKKYFDDVLSKSRLRDVYLSKLFLHSHDVTDSVIENKRYRALKAFAAAAEREVL